MIYIPNFGYFEKRLLISGVNLSIGTLSNENSIISSYPSLYAVISYLILSIRDGFPFDKEEFDSLGLLAFGDFEDIDKLEI